MENYAGYWRNEAAVYRSLALTCSTSASIYKMGSRACTIGSTFLGVIGLEECSRASEEYRWRYTIAGAICNIGMYFCFFMALGCELLGGLCEALGALSQKFQSMAEYVVDSFQGAISGLEKGVNKECHSLT